MQLVKTTTWDDVVNITASRLGWQMYMIGITAQQGLARDYRYFVQDFDCLGLPSMIDEGMFKVDLRDFQDGYPIVLVFDGAAADQLQFASWPRNYSTGRFVHVSLDGSHGEQHLYVAMFRDNHLSRQQAMQFKLAEC